MMLTLQGLAPGGQECQGSGILACAERDAELTDRESGGACTLKAGRITAPTLSDFCHCSDFQVWP